MIGFDTKEEVDALSSNNDKDDLIHVVCIKCNPDEKALCGVYPTGEWVTLRQPRPDECVVCLDLEDEHWDH